MPTPQQQSRQSDSEAIYEQGNIALMSRFIEEEAGKKGANKALQIANVLQTTLEIERLIEIYSNEIMSLIPHDQIVFENRSQGIQVHFGHAERHKCTYQLVLAATSLGQLTLSRKRKFSSNETVMLEYLLCALVYPLRNAITYKDALTAAIKDPLTGVNNRSALDSTLIREAEMARRHSTPLSLVAVDIDHFKQVNDSYGHPAGDHVLRQVADVMSSSIRTTDILFRAGGEEFILVLSSTDRAGAELIAERIRSNLENTTFRYDDTVIPVTASFGVTVFAHEDSCEELIARADAAMYRAKTDGRNCIRTL